MSAYDYIFRLKYCRVLLAIKFYLTLPAFLFGQNVSADFSVKPTACIGETILITNNSAGATHYEWDLCQGDLELIPSSAAIGTVSGSNIPTGMDVVYNGINTYVFIASRDNHSIIRVQLNSAGNAIQNITSMPVQGLASPVDIKIVSDNGKWYGFVYQEGNNAICRLDFDTSLTNIPTVAVPIISSNTATHNQGLDVISDGSAWYILYTFNSKVGIIKLNTIESIPVANDQFLTDNFDGNPVLADIKIMQEDGNFYAFTTSYGNSLLFRLSFQNQLLSAPDISDLSSFLVPSFNYFGIDAGMDNGTYYLFVSSLQGQIVRIKIGQTLSQTPIKSESLTNVNVFTNTVKNRLVKIKGRWSNFSIDYSNNSLFKATLPNPDCGNNEILLTEENPMISLNNPGIQAITLTAYGSIGQSIEKNKSVSISSSIAPVINIAVANNCVDSDIFFSLISNQPIANQTWNFGDLTPSSSDITPTHQFSNAGQYNVRLQATSSNGCQNVFYKQIKIYDPPVSAFTLPSGLMCTNNEFTFTNNTPDVFNGNLSYQWYVDNQPESTARDLKFTFSATGSKTIKLVTSIPGCSDELTQMTSAVVAGPVVNFSFAGICEGETTQFTNLISEMVTAYNWSFGDSNSSVESNPSHAFSTSGQYIVSLTAASPNGCNNTKTKTVTINQKPQPDFSVDAPPQSCSGTATNFVNHTPPLSDNTSVAEWLWDFNDTGNQSTSTLLNPNHIFVTAGVYNVLLKATSNAGCSNIFLKPISISQSPSATITNSVVCKNLPVNFAATGSSIKNYYWEMGTSYYLTDKPTHTFNTVGNQLVKLSITGNNNCITVYNRTVIIPAPLSPDFSVTRNCVGYDALFTDLTIGIDPIITRQWTLPGTEEETSSPTFDYVFNSSGSKEVKLKVTAQSGCSYATPVKTVNVVPAPKASFTPTPDHGATPLKVQFNNTSSNATLFKWSFPDGTVSVSTQPSPSFTFKELGNHQVDLVASNVEGCEDNASKSISVETPVPDVELKIITVSENEDGSLKVIITVHNKGNTVLNNLPVQIDISGNVLLKETIKEQITPSAMYNLVLSYGLTKTDNLKFLCAQADLQDDVAPESNRICTELQDKTFIFSSYPNPVYTELVIEWIARKDQIVHVFLYDAFGRKILHNEVQSSEGLNKNIFDVRELQSGIYFLIINDGFVQKTQRIFISPKN